MPFTIPFFLTNTNTPNTHPLLPLLFLPSKLIIIKRIISLIWLILANKSSPILTREDISGIKSSLMLRKAKDMFMVMMTLISEIKADRRGSQSAPFI